MKYEKPPKTFLQQADLLIERGLNADRNTLVARLKAVSYYRLSGYCYPFQNADNTFKEGANLDTIWNQYTFDRRLRLLVMDAIERVEVSVRTSLIYRLSHEYGPFGYTDSAHLPNLNSEDRKKFLQKIKTEKELSKEIFVERFREKYGDSHEHLPIWNAAEILTFGMLLTLFKGVDKSIQQSIAQEFYISDTVLVSWLLALNSVRNICAHHGRLWNREFRLRPKIPGKEKHPDWHDPVEVSYNRVFEVSNNRVFVMLTVLKYLMNLIAPQSKWPTRFDNLLAEYPEIPLLLMGFPENWRECPIWECD